MNKKNKEKFTNILVDEKKKIVRHLQDISGSTALSTDEGSGDPADIASNEINRASLQKIGKRETYLLRKIDYALKKIDEGTYGECESCGEDIGVKRLAARPVAQLCIDCKTEQENTEKRFQNWDQDENSGDVGDE